MSATVIDVRRQGNDFEYHFDLGQDKLGLGLDLDLDAHLDFE